MIKRLSLLIFSVIFCLTTFCCHAADVRRYTSAQIKSYVDNTPRNVENNIAPLVRYLTKPFNDDYDKAKAIAYWIASRIYYDDFLYSGTDNKDTYLRKGYQKQTPAKLLRSRSGICIDYANLFTAMCRKAGITARLIYGYAYPAQTAFSPAVRKNNAHAWNYFYYKGSKIYVDPTFMAGGTLGADAYPNSAKRNRALRQLRKDNKTQSMKSSVNDYYFDFSYQDEKRTHGQVHRER